MTLCIDGKQHGCWRPQGRADSQGTTHVCIQQMARAHEEQNDLKPLHLSECAKIRLMEHLTGCWHSTGVCTAGSVWPRQTKSLRWIMLACTPWVKLLRMAFRACSGASWSSLNTLTASEAVADSISQTACQSRLPPSYAWNLRSAYPGYTKSGLARCCLSCSSCQTQPTSVHQSGIQKYDCLGKGRVQSSSRIHH